MPENKTGATSPSGKKPKGKKEKSAEKALVKATRWLSWATGALVFVGIVGLVISYLHERAIEKTADAAKISADTGAALAKRQLRARISIISAEIEAIEGQRNLFGGSASVPIEAKIEIKNSGSGSAFGRLWREIRILPINISASDFPKTDVRGSGIEVGAYGNDTSVNIVRMQQAMTTTERSAVIAGTHGIFIYGEYRFDDESGARQRCIFRLHWRGVGTRPNTTLTLAPTSGGNSCKDEKP